MKRSVPIFFSFMLLLTGTILRLYSLMINTEAEMSSFNNSITVEAATSRGFIYDREMRPFVNEVDKLTALVSPTKGAVKVLSEISEEQSFRNALEKLTRGIPAAVEVKESVYEFGILNVRKPIRYSGEFLIPHLAGYCDGSGKGVCGLEKSFETQLSERKYEVTYKVDATGRALCGAEKVINDEGIDGMRGVVLTLDKDLQEIVRKNMLRSGIEMGAAVLLDVKSGDILAMVSIPEFDIYNIEKSLQDEGAPFINRALTAVSVGSVYKTVVAAAALESGVSEDFSYECVGNTVQSGVTFHCHNRSGHGELQMKGALLNSCNTWFINMAKTVDIERITELSHYMGLGTVNELADDVYGEAGIVPSVEELDSDAARANIAFGQGRLTATPLQISAMTAVFANGGIYTQPRLIQSTVDDDGRFARTEEGFSQRVISEKTADRLREMMIYCSAETKSMTFKNCGGKTATAENGVYINNVQQFNTWYSGFFPADEPKYVLTVFCENGNSGATDCTPVFEKIAEEILSKK